MANRDIALLIEKLRAEGAAERAQTAITLFERGAKLAESSIDSWLRIASLADLLLRGLSGGPQLTVGVAVQPETFERLRSANGAPRLAEVPADQDAREFELEYPGGVRLDILTTRQPGRGGAIDRFLQKFGEGIQQIEVLVSDIDRATKVLGAEFGIQPIYPAARPGADGTRVNFFLVPAPDKKKVLIEFVESR